MIELLIKYSSKPRCCNVDVDVIKSIDKMLEGIMFALQIYT